MNDNPDTDFSLILASSVHDMKNSLGMLLSSLEELIRDLPPANDRQSEQFAILQYEASRINTELIQLLSIYRMQKNRLPLHINDHYVVETIEDQIARNDMLFSTRGLQVDIECDEELLWYYDQELIGSVVHNVLVNAARYSSEKIQVRASIQDHKLVITIADDGDGYPDFMLENDAPDKDFSIDLDGGSTHLGLYFAQMIAAMHKRKDTQGRVLLANNSILGGGEFKIILP